jgi:hypothetical protein
MARKESQSKQGSSMNEITRKRKFTDEEDQKLLTLVEKYGTSNWKTVAENMVERTGRQCRDRYMSYLAPGFDNHEWSNDEDERLIRAIREFGRRWTPMAALFPGRPARALKNRYDYYLKRYIDIELPRADTIMVSRRVELYDEQDEYDWDTSLQTADTSGIDPEFCEWDPFGF